MQYAAVSFVEVERVVFKAKIGIDFTEISRNDWFDAYTVLPDSSEVYVVPDCNTDARFKDKSYVKGNPKIRFYAGAAIIVDNLKIGVLSIMDTEPHKFFSLEDKENLLDLGAAAAQLAKEKLQTALNLSAERANIVVSMMHHLRTPMTSLNFATSLLCNDVHNIRTDYAVAASHSPMDDDRGAIDESKDNNTPFQPPHSVFQSFESSFTEISNALNQLNILVDSSLSLGQAIIKCSTNEVSSNATANLQAMDPRSRFTECNIIDYLSDMFQNNLPVHNHNLEIEWIVDTTDLVRGSHVTFPDAVMLIVISTVSHMSTESNSLGFHFSFEQVDEDDMEYPELISKMLEGRLSIKVFAKDSRAFAAPIDSAAMMMDDGAMANASSSMDAASSTPRRPGGGSSNSNGPSAGNANGSNNNNNAPDMLSKQNFLSIDKILRAINGSSREYVDDVMLYATMRAHQGELLAATGDAPPPSQQPQPSQQPEYRTIHEFLVPCKILLTPFADGGRSPNQQQQHLRFYRPSSKHLAAQGGGGGDAASAAATPMHGGSVRITPSSKSGALHHPHAQQQVHLDAPHLSSTSSESHSSPTGHNAGGSGAQGSTAAVAQSSGVAVPPPINTTGGVTPHNGGPFGLNLQPLPTAAAANGSSKAPATAANANVATTANANANSAAHTAAGAETSPPQPETRQLRVLVVEDTIPVQKLLTRWLQNQDCLVTCASNGKVGLELLTSQAFDIAFVDFLMPVMLGITTMKLFQAWLGDHPTEKEGLAQENASVLIVGMSATALESEQEEAFNYGMHFFCPKPVSLELLRIILDAKRAHAADRLDASIDMICDVTGTDANDGVATAASVAAAAASAAASASAAAANDGDANANGNGSGSGSGGAVVNPKNKWTFFRSCRQARSNAGANGNDEGNATDDT